MLNNTEFEADEPIREDGSPTQCAPGTKILMVYGSEANLDLSRALLHQLVRIGDQAAQDARSVGEPQPLPPIPNCTAQAH